MVVPTAKAMSHARLASTPSSMAADDIRTRTTPSVSPAFNSGRARALARAVASGPPPRNAASRSGLRWQSTHPGSARTRA